MAQLIGLFRGQAKKVFELRQKSFHSLAFLLFYALGCAAFRPTAARRT